MKTTNKIKEQIKGLNTLLCHLSVQKKIEPQIIYKLCNTIKNLKNSLKLTKN
jgi:hypothetical protein